jgi:hypothetical protein
MRGHFRGSLLALLTVVTVGVSVPAAAQAAFGIQKFVAINCKTGFEACGGEEISGYSFPKAPSKAEAEEQGYTQAGGHVPYGITDFEVNTEGVFPNLVPSGLLTQGPVSHIRTDVSTGLATNPTAVPQCTEAEFGATEAIPGTGFYEKAECKTTTRIGTNKVVVYVGENGAGAGISDLPLEGPAYNLVQREGLASEFGVSVALPEALTKKALEEAFAAKGHPLGTPTEEALEKKIYYSHTLIEGSVEWGKEAGGTGAGDFHDYFNINVSTALPLISSRLVFEGTKDGDFITNATSCPGDVTSYLTLTDAAGKANGSYTALLGIEKCSSLEFLPTFALTPGSFEHDEPVGLSAEIAVPQHAGAGELNSSQLQNATIVFPEGMTLNPSAAAKLKACSGEEARIHSSTSGTACPAESELGEVELEVPTLPAGSLKGKIYLGSGSETGTTVTSPPYIVYVDAESERYGVSVRLEGKVEPNAQTGQVTTVFEQNPQQPFTSIKLSLKSGPYAPIASPLACGTATASSTLAPYATGVASASRTSSFTVTGCPSTLPFSLSQSIADSSTKAGAHTTYTFTLKRETGEQYLNNVSTTLPEGLNGAIPVVALCGEALAKTGKCPAASEIGTATVLAGAGADPYSFSGPVYLTGPYDGAPYGMSIAVPATAGPFSLGTIVTRATINVNEVTGRITVASVLPTIYDGIPLRIRELKVAIGAQNFLTNPTSCSALPVETTLTSTLGASQSLSSSLQVADCSALAFKPTFAAKSSATTSKANGASLETTINQPPGEADIASVLVQLPLQLPSRLTTLQKACPEAVFAANPYACPAGSKVGGVRANTPLLPEKMTGPAYLVSHGGEAFPDLDLVLVADGVKVILTGHTKIAKGITTTYFQTLPDVPVSSITVNLPTGPYSALAANGSLCRKTLLMPTTMTAKNGRTFKQTTKIKVPGCPVEVVGRKVIGDTAYLTVRTYEAGRISGRGSGLSTVYRHLSGADTASLKVPLSSSGAAQGRPFSVRIRVGFVPSRRSLPTSVAFQTVTFG